MDISQSSKFAEAININVGGTHFVTTMKSLRSVPDTRLTNISTTSAEYVPELNIYFFDRNPELFNCVLDYYRTGELHLPKHVCGAAIRNELEYWQISPGSISDCCVSSLFRFEDELEVTNNLKEQFESNGLEYTKEDLDSSKWNRVKNLLWNFLEKPNSSRNARIFSIVYFLFVVMTCVTFILGTHQSFRKNINHMVEVNSSLTVTLYEYLLMEHKNKKLALLWSTEQSPSIEYINAICTFFFTVELLLRFLSCPERRLFFKFLLNVVDLITVVSMVVSFVLYTTERFDSSSALLWGYVIVSGLVILRLLRLFRLAKHYSGLKILYLALKASSQELGLLLLTFIIATSLFGGLVYYAEFSSSETFENVPIAIWWAIVTLTTVGYGDYYPVTPIGYIIGALCGMCGLLLLSMPIAVIATNFNDYYSRNKIREKQLKRKKDIFNKIRSLFKTRNVINVMHLDHIDGTPRGEDERTNRPATTPETDSISRSTQSRFRNAFIKVKENNKAKPK